MSISESLGHPGLFTIYRYFDSYFFLYVWITIGRNTRLLTHLMAGGIFNLEFSPDGKILSAACERRNILIFDPLTRRVIQNLENAHLDCVNCVRNGWLADALLYHMESIFLTKQLKIKNLFKI